MKIAALAWGLVVAAACMMLLLQLHKGVKLQTDMTALLPTEERDTFCQSAKDRVTGILAQRVFILIGDDDRSNARAGGAALAKALEDSGMTAAVTYRIRQDSLKSLGAMYFPYRFGLLTAADRERLQQNHGAQIVDRAIASVYGPSSIADANLLQRDPFLLIPEFLTNLPMPVAQLTPDDGVLSTRDGNQTWVLLVAQMNGNVYSGAFQERFISAFNATEHKLRATMPHLQVLRVGAIFYAHAGAKSATEETTRLSIVSLLGTIVLILIVFRALRPLWLTLLAIAVGMLCAFAVCLSIFGGIHVAALLFGVSLIGISIDYCLQYVCAGFGAEAGLPNERLHQVLPGITLGVATTLIGYATLLLAPFTGLHQLAVFSAVGLLGSFLTIVLWLPFLDRRKPLLHGARILATANLLWEFWAAARYSRWRWGLIALVAILTIVGATRLRFDDDVRHQQALAGSLRNQESQIRRLTGISGGTEFLLVRAPDRDGALQTEEALQSRLTSAEQDGAIRGFQSIAQFIPSIARQREDRGLVHDKLMLPYLASYYQRLSVTGGAQADTDTAGFLTPDAISDDSPLSFLRNLILESDASGTMHVVLLTGISRPDEIRRIAEAVPGVRFVDPAGDVTRLLGEYRRRATILIAVSVILMMPVLIWRYGLRGSLRVALPPAIAVLAAAPLVALAGVTFTFFNAMALVLVLSIGFDYAVFCRESKPSRRPATMLGVWLAMLTTLLSFGLLVLSSTYAVHAFGATLLVGTIMAFAFAPIASDLDEGF
ncbi:MMPL family transporter [Candidatus Binatus sp.]|uniref:MMPL family transporter n=1 Tax=Candidatus Binatus sp. TaxID=2811406 RepID=UPI002FDB16BA